MTDKQEQNSEYILATGVQGAVNLDLQHEIFKQESFAQLKEAGLAKNMVVWDIGCGSGIMTEHLAEAVGSEGLVYALDVSEDQIKVAKNRIEAAGYKNVQFIVGDINALDASKYQKADLVYSPFLLMHVPDPEKVIKHMASLLKPGGVISLQESTMNTTEEHPSDPSIHKYYRLIIEYGRIKGFDYNIGRKLPEICDTLGVFSKVNYYTRNYKATDHIKTLMAVRVPEVKDKFVSANLITEEEYTKLADAISHFLRSEKSDDCVMMAEQSHILAHKKEEGAPSLSESASGY